MVATVRVLLTFSSSRLANSNQRRQRPALYRNSRCTVDRQHTQLIFVARWYCKLPASNLSVVDEKRAEYREGLKECNSRLSG